MKIMRLLVVVLMFAVVGHAVAAQISKLPAVIIVEAGGTDRIDTPVSVSLAESVAAKKASLMLYEIKGDKKTQVSSQVVGLEKNNLVWLLSGRTEKGATRRFELKLVKKDDGNRVTAEKTESVLKVSCAGKDVVYYNHKPYPAPKGAQLKKYPHVYGRTGFIHPLKTLSGKVLTDIYPGDHIHHVGLWHPWTKTSFEGKHVDFWNLKSAQGTVRFVEFADKESGPVCGGFTAKQEHVVLKAQGGGEKVALNEQFRVRVWSPAENEKGYLLDYVMQQSAASDSPLKIGPYRYGGFGFRATPEWQVKTADYLTAEGKTRKGGNTSRTRWCRVEGKLGDGTGGILFMSSPQNFEHPESIRIWDAPNSKGVFFNFNPAQKKAIVIEKDKDALFRYRVYVYDGKLSKEDCERLWQDYGNPPVVTVE